MPKNIREMHSQQEIFNWVYDPLNNWLRTNGDPAPVVAALEDVLAELQGIHGDVATQATLLAVLTKLETIRTQVASESTLLAIKALLESLALAPNTLYEVEGQTGQNVGPAGIVITLAPLPRKMDFNQIYARLVFGSAAQFRIELLKRNPDVEMITDLDIIYDNKGAKSPFTNPTLKSWDYIVYNRLIAKNAHNLDEFYLRIMPDNGTSNQFIYRVNGFPLR